MQTKETEFILPRTITPAHYKLKIPHSRSKTARDYYREIGLVFDHQKAVFFDENESDDEETTLARQFYREFYVPPHCSPIAAPPVHP